MHLQHEQTDCQAADINTQALLNGDMCDHVARLVGVGDHSTMTAATEIHFWSGSAELRDPGAAHRAGQTGAVARVVVSVDAIVTPRKGGGMPTLSLAPALSLIFVVRLNPNLEK